MRNVAKTRIYPVCIYVRTFLHTVERGNGGWRNGKGKGIGIGIGKRSHDVLVLEGILLSRWRFTQLIHNKELSKSESVSWILLFKVIKSYCYLLAIDVAFAS